MRLRPHPVNRFASSFVDGAVTAGLAETDNGQVILVTPGAAEVTGLRADEDLDDEVPRPEPSRRRMHAASVPPVVHQEGTLPVRAVLFEVRLDRPLPAAAFAQVGTVVQEIEALAGHLQALVTTDEAGM